MNRFVELQGLEDFRDLGGYATPVGITRWRRVYRSDNLVKATEDDVRQLLDLGLHRRYLPHTRVMPDSGRWRAWKVVELDHELACDQALRGELGAQAMLDLLLPAFGGQRRAANPVDL